MVDDFGRNPAGVHPLAIARPRDDAPDDELAVEFSSSPSFRVHRRVFATAAQCAPKSASARQMSDDTKL
jgi:hypothetical protein